MFDKDGGGSIDPSELREIVRGLFCLAGIKVPDEILDNRCQVNIIKLQTKVCESSRGPLLWDPYDNFTNTYLQLTPISIVASQSL